MGEISLADISFMRFFVLSHGGKHMLSDTFLNLSGYARLYDIRRCQKDERLITLNLINDTDHPRPDDIWLDCDFDMKKFPLMTQLENLLAMEKNIILKFEASYSTLQECYHDPLEENPEAIVLLKGKLLHIHEYAVEEENILDWHMYALESDKVSLELGA